MNSNNVLRTGEKHKLRHFIFYLIFLLIFTGATAPLIVYHGPFSNVKKTIVDAAMTTLSHQWIVKLFLSDAEIQKIRSEDTVQIIQQGNGNFVKFDITHDNTIERYDISQGMKFSGYVLIIRDPTRVKVGYSSKLGTEGELTSQIAQDYGAVAAVNAGGFTDSSSANTKWTGTGGIPEGIIMSNGVIKFNDITNYDKKANIVAITKKGLLLVEP